MNVPQSIAEPDSLHAYNSIHWYARFYQWSHIRSDDSGDPEKVTFRLFESCSASSGCSFVEEGLWMNKREWEGAEDLESYLEPGESTEVGSILQGNVTRCATSAFVHILARSRYRGHG